jgi:hypothetical protein
MSLDTVIGKQEIERCDFEKFSGWHSTSNRDERGQTYKKFYKQIAVGNFATMELFAEHRWAKTEFGFSASLPKFAYDNNVQMLLPHDLEQVAERIDNLVEHYTGIPFDSLNARLSRADIAYNFQLCEDEVNRRIAAAKLVRCYGQNVKMIEKEKGVPSVYLGRKNYNELYLYSKAAEIAVRVKQRTAGDEHFRNAIGILRLENARYAPKLRRDAERLGIKQITLATFLDPHFAEEILMDSMKKFSLDRTIAGRDERREKLKIYCGDDGAKRARLQGLMDIVDEDGEQQAIADLGYYLVHRGKKELMAAGVWLAAENRIPLPALAPPKFENLVLDLSADCGLRSNTSQQFAPVQTFIN